MSLQYQSPHRPSFPSDFRPVSVIPVIAKVYESLIYKQLYIYLTTNSLLQPNQFGFWPSHSTQDALLKTMDDWCIALGPREEYWSSFS